VASQFTGDYGLTPNEANDYVVIGLITQMGGTLSDQNQALEAIAVWLVNRYGVTDLKHLQFLWTPDSQECGGNDEAYSCTYTPGFFRAVNLDNGAQIPTQFAQFDDGAATYYLGFKPDKDGKPIFGLVYAQPRKRSELKQIALPLLAITSMVFDWSGTLGAAILGVGDAVAGAALAGEIALQVGISGTQVAQIVGSAAAGTVTSGGDPVKAIENAAASFLGAQAGNFVASAVDSAAAAKIASAAVTAAAKGQDIGQAILTSGATTAAGAVASAITTRSTMDDILFPNNSSQGVDPGFSIWIDDGDAWQFAPGNTIGDVVVSLDELGITGDILIDDQALANAGVPLNAQLPDETGTLFNVSGQFTSIPAEVYASEVYAVAGPGGGVVILGPDNNVLLTELEVANITSEADLQTKTLQALSARSGLMQPSGPAPNGRPADTTAPADRTSVGSILDVSKVAESLTKSLATIFTVIKQVENGTYGRVQSPYGSTSPYGTLRPQVPGVPVRNADGSVTVNNGNGTQTTTLPTGQKITTSTSMSTAGAFGGVSTNTLLIAGAGLAALLLLRRK
jgi:hypothetical protein